MKWLRSVDKRIFLIVGLIILIFLMMDFNSRMNELTRLDQEYDKLSGQVTQLAQTAQLLTTQIAYATSDVAVQDYARNDGKMIEPGDNPVVPIAPEGNTPQPTAIPITVQPQVANWQIWYALFFGE
jgi:cell division protein FtsB